MNFIKINDLVYKNSFFSASLDLSFSQNARISPSFQDQICKKTTSFVLYI